MITHFLILFIKIRVVFVAPLTPQLLLSLICSFVSCNSKKKNCVSWDIHCMWRENKMDVTDGGRRVRNRIATVTFWENPTDNHMKLMCSGNATKQSLLITMILHCLTTFAHTFLSRSHSHPGHLICVRPFVYIFFSSRAETIGKLRFPFVSRYAHLFQPFIRFKRIVSWRFLHQKILVDSVRKRAFGIQ